MSNQSTTSSQIHKPTIRILLGKSLLWRSCIRFKLTILSKEIEEQFSGRKRARRRKGRLTKTPGLTALRGRSWRVGRCLRGPEEGIRIMLHSGIRTWHIRLIPTAFWLGLWTRRVMCRIGQNQIKRLSQVQRSPIQNQGIEAWKHWLKSFQIHSRPQELQWKHTPSPSLNQIQDLNPNLIQGPNPNQDHDQKATKPREIMQRRKRPNIQINLHARNWIITISNNENRNKDKDKNKIPTPRTEELANTHLHQRSLKEAKWITTLRDSKTTQH